MQATGQTFARQQARGRFALLAQLVAMIDRRLRDRLGIIEFSNSPDCIFRLQIIEGDDELPLGEGAWLRVGDRVVDLHLWNEHVPVMPGNASTLGHARRIERCINSSLSELASYLAGRRELDDIRAIRGNMSFGSDLRSEQIAKLASKFGFKRIVIETPLSRRQKLHRLGENILITMLTIVHNAGAVKADTLRRGRTLTYLSRADLERRYAQ